MRGAFLLAAFSSLALPAEAVYKCLNEEGDAVIYSDAPCPATKESQPVNARRNAVELDAADRERLREEEARKLRRTREIRSEHGAQAGHARQVQRAAEAEEAARAARNAQVRSKVPRPAVANNPRAPGPQAPGYYHR